MKSGIQVFKKRIRFLKADPIFEKRIWFLNSGILVFKKRKSGFHKADCCEKRNSVFKKRIWLLPSGILVFNSGSGLFAHGIPVVKKRICYLTILSRNMLIFSARASGSKITTASSKTLRAVQPNESQMCNNA